MGRLIVIKFGGTSLGTAARVRRAARRVRAHVRDGDQHNREYDRALATGEDLSAALFAAALASIGVRARSLRGGEAGLVARGEHGAATLDSLDATTLRTLLANDVVPVVAGFQAIRADGETVTIGRNGSDATAVFLAGKLHANACHIVTDVASVCDTDPKTNPHARAIPHLSHGALRQLTESGSEVVQHAAALLAEQFGTRLHVYHFDAPYHEPRGTVVAGAAS